MLGLRRRTSDGTREEKQEENKEGIDEQEKNEREQEELVVEGERGMKGFLLGYCNLHLESFSRPSATLASKFFGTLYGSSSADFIFFSEEGRRRGAGRGNITEIEI